MRSRLYFGVLPFFFKRCPLVVNVLFTSLQKVPLPDAFIAAVYVTEIIIISYLLSFWSFVFIFLNHLNQ